MKNSRGRGRLALGIALALAFAFNGYSFAGRSATAYSLPHGPTPTTQPEAGYGNVDSSLPGSEAFAKLPLSFEANVGQADPKLRFISRGSNYTIALTPTEAILTTRTSGKPESNEASAELSPAVDKTQVDLHMRLIGASKTSRVEGADRLDGKLNYFIGNNRSNWVTGVPTFGGVRQRGVYPGIDLVYYGHGQQLEYDFIVAPRANPRAISIEFEGAQGIRVDAGGDLVLETPLGEVRQHKPVAYQESGGIRKEVAARIEIKGRRRVSFWVGSYDRTKPLVIDPVLVYSTLYPNGRDLGDIVVDSAGNMYIAGYGPTNTLHPTPGAVQGANGTNSLFVTKLNAAGTAVVYTSVLGGQTGDTRYGRVALDSEGNAYVSGTTTSEDYPTSAGAFQRVGHGSANSEGFVTKLNPSGSSIVYSTYLGGGGADSALDIAVDAAGNALVAGSTTSNDFPVTPGAFRDQKNGISSDGFVTKLNAAGSSLVYSTYLGGSATDRIEGIALDAAGNAYLVGSTNSTNFPTTSDSVQPSRIVSATTTTSAAFVAKLSSTGSELIYATYLGDSSYGQGIAVDSLGQACVTGSVTYDAFPTVNALQSPHPMAFLAKSSDGGTTWSTLTNGLPRTGAIFRNPPIVDPQDPSRLYVAVTAHIGNDSLTDAEFASIRGLYRSTDAGNHWTVLRNGLPPSGFLASVVLDPTNPSTLYAASWQSDIVEGRLYKSTDHGDTWSQISTGISGGYLTINPANASTMFVTGHNSRLLKSTDGGVSWQQSDQGMPNDGGPITAIAIHPQTPSIVFAMTLEKIWRSTNEGSTWTAVAEITGGNASMAFDPQTPSTIYAVTVRGDSDAAGDDGRGNPRKRSGLTEIHEGAMKSTDSGSTWTSINKGLSAFNTGLNSFFVPYSLVIDPAVPSTVYIGAADGLFKTINGGNTWFLVDMTVNGVALGIGSKGDRSLYAGFGFGGLGSGDAFVSKLNPTGTAFVYSTCLGGLGMEMAFGIAVDDAGNAYVAGSSSSRDFLTSLGAFQPSKSGTIDAFLVKLNSTGTVLDYSTLLGGSSSEWGRDIALDGAGNIYLAGTTDSADYPTVNPMTTAFQDPTKPRGSFIAKFSNSAVNQSNIPAVTGAQVRGKKLIVTGDRFHAGAVILIDGREQATSNDSQSPGTTLMAKKAGKRIVEGQQVMIRVRNADGMLSNQYSFTRPVE